MTGAFRLPLAAPGVSWIAATLICYGAVGDALAWIGGPSRAILKVGAAPCARNTPVTRWPQRKAGR